MKINKILLAATAAAFVLAAAPSWAEGPALPAWASAVAGEKLVAVDGSTLTLAAGDSGLSLTRVLPGGATQNTAYTFLAEKLGTIADGGDASHVTGFFRVTDSGLEAQYGDGRTEQLFANAAGGLSLNGHGPGAAGCVSWYPADHVFGAAERRAAVAAYAASLGVDQPAAKGKSAPHVATNCAAPLQARTARASHAASPGLLAPLTTVTVRTSDVHAVNDTAPAAVAAAPVVTASAQPVAAKLVTAAATSDSGRGASNCLSVESDGASLGFRNHCVFNVQFVYCLQNKDDPQALCNVETRTGSVPPNAFVALLSDTNIKPEDAEHDFRWVACSGSGVTAYLDRTEPPSGRCVRANAS